MRSLKSCPSLGLAKTSFAVLVLVSAATPGASRADDLPVFFKEEARRGFEAAAASGDRSMIEHFGGTMLSDGRVFEPGADVMGILGSEFQASLEALEGSGTGLPSWMNGSSRRTGPPPWNLSEEARKAATEEVRELLKKAKDFAEGAEINESPKQHSESDYLPSISLLLSKLAATLPVKPAPDPSLLAQAVSRPVALAKWLEMPDQQTRETEMIYGFIEPCAGQEFLFVDEKGAVLDVLQSHSVIPDLLQSEAKGGNSADACRVTVQIPEDVLAPFMKTKERFSKEVLLAFRARCTSSGPLSHPSAAYRWIFGQLVNGNGARYIPFKQVSGLPPRLRVAIHGTASRDGNNCAIKVSRFLVSTSPLPCQSETIVRKKGMPATLVDSEGIYETVFIACPLYCTEQDRWFGDRPAMKKVSLEPDEYLTAILTASFADIEKMNSQLQDEIHSSTVLAMESAFSDAVLSSALKTAGADSKIIKSTGRLLTKGLGRAIRDQTVTLFAGQVKPAEGVRKLTEDRVRFLKLAKDPQVANFISSHLLDSFLILAIDQEGVCLCDFRSALEIHARYASLSSSGNFSDPLAHACQFAEIGQWLSLVKGGSHVPLKPPFSVLPASVEARRKLLANLSSLAFEEERKAAREENPATTESKGFSLPGK